MRQRAQVLVLFALLLPVLLAALGLAVEGGFALAQRQRMQAAADLAAVNGVYCQLNPARPMCTAAASFPGSGGSAARGMALSIATANGFNSATVQFPYAGDANKLSVALAQPVPTPLLGLIGFGQFDVTARAVASIQSGVINASVLALSPTRCGAIALSGNGAIDVNIGAVVVNSTCSTALTASGNATITAPAIMTSGGYTTSGNARFTPTPTTGMPPTPDPLAAVPPPDAAGLTVRGTVSCGSNNTVTLLPGIYTSITISSNCVATMQPGIFVLAGGGLSVSGSGSLSGDGVMLYNASGSYPASGGTFGPISLSGNGSIHLTPQTSGTYKGLLIFQARDNPRTLTLSGNSAVAGIQGTVYGPSMPVSVSGNGTLPAQFVVDSVDISGNGTLTVQYSGAQVYGVPSMALIE